MDGRFRRRVFSPRLFLTDIGFLLSRSPQMVAAIRNPDVSRPFVEKLMMVTTAVNGCVYCEWVHARQAVACGISQDEIRELLDLQFEANATEFESLGLLYAQHYAETNRSPDVEMTTRLFEQYGERTARDIILAIRLIFFGNLLGNTWDAALSRFRGSPARDSKLVFELVFLPLTAWIMLPLMLLRRLRPVRL